jgi:methionine synthase I (cobalamin-dependent)
MHDEIAVTVQRGDLVTLDHVGTGDPDAWASSMARLGQEAGIPVLGGCCGTDGRHLRALASLLTS